MKSLPSHPASDLTPVLFLIAGSSVWLYSIEELRWAAFLLPCVLLLPCAVSVSSRRTSIALAAMIGTAAMPRYFIEILGAKARPEHIATGLLCIAAPFVYKRRPRPTRWLLPDLFVLALIVINFVSSIFMSVAPGQTFKWSFQQMLAILPYFLIRIFVSNGERFRLAVRIMLIAATVAAGYAVVCFYSNRLIGTTFGVDVGQYGDIPGIYGSQFEANLLGSYCAASLVIMLVLYFRGGSRKLLWGSAVLYFGLIVSLSRAAVAAAAVALIALLIVSLRMGIPGPGTLRRAAFALIGVTAIAAASIMPLYLERFSTLSVSDPIADDTTKVRVLGLVAAGERSLEHPVLGAGTNSFQLDFDFAEIGYTGVDAAGWIGNTEMRVWHDTGLVGLAFFIAFIAVLIIYGWRTIRSGAPPELLGLFIASLVYLISFQMTDGTILSFPWVHLGMISTGVALFNANVPDKAAAAG